MKAEIKISRSHLRQLLNSIDRINSVPDDNEHADVNLKIRQNSIYLYSNVDPTFVSHTLTSGEDISVEIDEPGRMSFNTQTLSNIVQKSTDGELAIKFTSSKYHVISPSGKKLSSVQFHLPKFTDSEFQDAINFGQLHSIESLSRIELKNGLDMMSVIDEFVKISLNENSILSISVNNVVNGDAEMEAKAEEPEIQSMSQFYMLRPMKEFANTITDAEDIEILVGDNLNICLRSKLDGWKAEMILAQKMAPNRDTFLEIS